MRKRILYALLGIFAVFTFFACSDDDHELAKPVFSELTISPQQDVYHVGDKVTLSVTMTSSIPDIIKAAKYWFYYDYATKAMFVTPDEDTGVFTSPEITLTKAGDTELSFWAQFDYPNYQYDGVTRYLHIQVLE